MISSSQWRKPAIGVSGKRRHAMWHGIGVAASGGVNGVAWRWRGDNAVGGVAAAMACCNRHGMAYGMAANGSIPNAGDGVA